MELIVQRNHLTHRYVHQVFIVQHK
jgi:16S rRNA U1498 N3-methylase RsmE